MRTTATLLLLTAIGCGGAGENSRASTSPQESSPEATSPAAAEPTPAPAATAAAEPAAPATAAAPSAPQPGQAGSFAAPAASPDSPGVARAEIKSVSGDKSIGTMTFERKDSSIEIAGTFSGLKKGEHALYIHTKGDCSDRARKVGAHLNPTGAKHGPPASAMRHAGDFGDLTADKEGNASFSMTTDSVTLDASGRPDSVINRAVVVYARKDSKSGKAGTPIACGVVRFEGAAPEAQSAGTSAPAPAPAKASQASSTAVR